MINTDKYEDAKKMVQDAELIDENDGHPDIHYRKIAHLLAEVKRLREQLSKARNWVSDYFTDINGDYMTWEGRDLHADFIKELEMVE